MFEDQEIAPAALAARLDEAARGMLSAYAVAEAISLTSDEKESPIGALLLAFQLYGREGQQLAPDEGYFALAFGGEVSNVLPEVIDIWVACADHVSEPVCQARLHDICFELRRGDVAHHIRTACDAYLSMAAINPHTSGIEEIELASACMRRVHELSRVYSLAKRSKMTDIEARVVSTLLDAAQEAVDSGTPGPGELLGLLDPLIETSSDQRVDDLLAKARALYVEDPHATAETIILQARRTADDATWERLKREQVAGYIEFAMKAQGGMRQVNLEIAIKLARDFGFTDLVDDATQHLQSMNVEDLGLRRIETKISLDREELDRFFSQFTAQPSWVEALALTLAVGPPSGNIADNRASAAAARAAGPLTAVIPKKRVGGDGLPRYVATTAEEKEEWQLAEQETMRLQVWAGIMCEVLQRIGEKWEPDVDDLTALLGCTPHVQPAVSASVARAFRHFFDDDPEAAAYIALPKIEALVRDLVLAMNLPIYRTQREKTPGQYPGLGALMPELVESGMDQSWSRYITTLLSSPSGWNVRNEALHGFLPEVGSPYAALILIAALYLCLGVSIATAIAGDDQETDGS